MKYFLLLLIPIALCACSNPKIDPMVGPSPNAGGRRMMNPPMNTMMPKGAPIVNQPTDKIVKTDEEWRKILTPEQYHITRERGTERAFTGAYWNTHTPGVYVCAGCGQELFDSTTKFESGTGWPSFYQAIADGRIDEETDQTHGMKRVEVHCSRCGAHLGHVFNDGPKPTGLRYCINSPALVLKERK